jgi:hypothetical protein
MRRTGYETNPRVRLSGGRVIDLSNPNSPQRFPSRNLLRKFALACTPRTNAAMRLSGDTLPISQESAGQMMSSRPLPDPFVCNNGDSEEGRKLGTSLDGVVNARVGPCHLK